MDNKISLKKITDWKKLRPIILQLEKYFGDDVVDSLKYWCKHHKGNIRNDLWKIYTIIDSNSIIYGIIGYYDIIINKKKTIWVGWFGLLSKYHGNGVAIKAFDLYLKNLKRFYPNLKELYLYTEIDNFRAINFYKKFDFEIINTVDDFCTKKNIDKDFHFTTNTVDIVLMKKL